MTNELKVSPSSQRLGASTVTGEDEGGTAREAPASVKEKLKEKLQEEVKEVLKEVLKEVKEVKEVLKVEEVAPTLGQLKEVRELCRRQAENGSFPTLAALITGFSLGVLPTLKYGDKYFDNDSVKIVQDPVTPVGDNYDVGSGWLFENPADFPRLVPDTEGCDPCGSFLSHTVLAYIQAMLLGLTGILSAVSMIGFFLVVLKGTKILSSLEYVVDKEGSGWKDIEKADYLNSWKPPSEIYIITKQVNNFLNFWARCEVLQSRLRGIFWSSLITLMLSCAVSPNLYCFHCYLGICISAMMVVGCLTVLIGVTRVQLYQL